MTSRNLLSALVAGAFLAFGSGLASAQDYPTKPITFIYPYSAGSPLDNAWRLITEAVSEDLGQPIIYENKPGAGGLLGFQSVMQAPPDGHTIGLNLTVTAVWQPLIDAASPDLQVGRDYEQIIIGLEHLLVLVARKDLPYSNLQGLIDYAKANPSKINAGTAGPGTGGHFGMAMLESKAGIDLTEIHYNGTGPAVTGLLAGETDILFTDIIAKQHVGSGAVVALGVGAEERWSYMPDVPTMPEQGLTEFRNVSWSGVAAPAGTPAEILDTLNASFDKALKSPDVGKKLQEAGWVVVGGDRASAVERVETEFVVYEPIIKDANISLN